MTILQTANEWLTIGVSPIPICKNGKKLPATPWKRFQTEMPTINNLAMWFAEDTFGLGVCTGVVEMLEFEGSAMEEGLYEQFLERLRVTPAPNGRGTMEDVWKRIYHGYSEMTPREGIHGFYRVVNSAQRKNTPLSRRPAREDELNEGEELGRAFRVQVETRGKGGMAVVAPSGPDVSLKAVGWRMISGGPRTIVKITIAERDTLWAVARSLNTFTPTPLRNRTKRISSPEAAWGEDRTWESILEPHGWVLAQTSEVDNRDGEEPSEGVQYWRHPSAHSGWSATVGAGTGDVADCLYVFSTSTDFESGFFYTKMEAVALFEHDGDVRAARESVGILHTPEEFVIPNEGLQVAVMAQACQEDGPLAVGADRLIWYYRDGVWQGGEQEFGSRMADLLENRFRTSHAANVRAYLDAKLPKLSCDAVCPFCKDRPPLSDEYHINFLNGMVDWQTGELVNHDPAFDSTVQLRVNYNPNATCEVFDSFVRSIMHSDAVELYWQFLGYLLLNGNPLQRAFLLLGKGGNGKGVTERMLHRLIGKSNFSNVTLDQLNENRFAAADMVGKLVNWAGDIDATYQKKTASIKAITGDGSFRTEHKNKDAFSFTPWATPVFSGNAVPPSADTTRGYVRRWEIIEFPNEFDATSDPNLESRISEELEGIAAKAVCALRQLMADRDFLRPDTALSAKTKFIDTSNSVARFLKECCVDNRHELEVLIKDSPSRRTLGTEPALPHLYGSVYRQWAEAENVPRLGRNNFYERVRGEGFSAVPTDGKLVFAGLLLKAGVTSFGTFGPVK